MTVLNYNSDHDTSLLKALQSLPLCFDLKSFHNFPSYPESQSPYNSLQSFPWSVSHITFIPLNSPTLLTLLQLHWLPIWSLAYIYKCETLQRLGEWEGTNKGKMNGQRDKRKVMKEWILSLSWSGFLMVPITYRTNFLTFQFRIMGVEGCKMQISRLTPRGPCLRLILEMCILRSTAHSQIIDTWLHVSHVTCNHISGSWITLKRNMDYSIKSGIKSP